MGAAPATLPWYFKRPVVAVALLIALLIVPSFLLGAALLRSVRASAQRDEVAVARANVAFIAGSLQDQLLDLHHYVFHHTRAARLREFFATGNAEALDSALRGLLDSHRLFQHAYLLDEQNRVLHEVHRAGVPTASLTREALAGLIRPAEDRKLAHLLIPAGIAGAETPAGAILMQLAQNDGQPPTQVLLQYDLAFLTPWLTHQPRARNGHFSLLDSAGNMVTIHGDQPRLITIPQPEAKLLWDKPEDVRLNERSQITFGEPSIVCTTRAGNSGWLVVLSLPRAEHFGHIEVLWKRLALIALGGALLLFGVGIPIYRVALRNFREKESVRRELENLNQALEQEVRQRTAELESRNAQLNLRLEENLRLQQEIARSETMHRALVTASPDAIFVSVDHHFAWANPAAAIAFGVRNEQELIGRHCSDFVPPDQWENMRSRQKHLYQKKGPYPIVEEAIRRADGTFRPVEVAAEAFDYEGKPATLAIVRDLTERKKLEEKLESATGRLELAIQAQNIGIWEWDVPNGSYQWSPEMCRLCGVDPATFAPGVDAFTALVHPEDHELLHDTLENIAAQNDEFTLTLRIVRPDGALRWIDNRAKIFRDEHGAPVTVLGIALDHTEKALLSRQMAEAHKMESVGRLAGGVAHEFNNILGAILGYCELLLQQTPQDSPYAHDLKAINDSAQRAARLVSHLLAFAQQHEQKPQACDLNDLIRAFSALLQRMLGENVRLLVALDTAIPQVWIDPRQFEQIIVHMALNARDAMPVGGAFNIATHHVSLSEQEAADRSVAHGEYVAIEIADTGTGMSHAVASKAFEPFFTTKERGKGTGLGLSMCYGIVQAAGGHIEIDSRDGLGTTFRIYLPGLKTHSSAQVQETPLRLSPAEGEHILICEDDPMLRELTQRILERVGYCVTAVATAHEAIEACKSTQIDLVLMDLMLPDIPGADAVRKCRKLQPRLRALYMSGYALDQLAEGGKLPHNGRVLQKPFDAQELTAAVRAALEESEDGPS